MKKKWSAMIRKIAASCLVFVTVVTSVLGDSDLVLPVHAETKVHTVNIGGANAFSSKKGSGSVSLSRSHSPFGISSLGRPNSHPLWNIRVSGHRVFCTNGDKSLCTGDHVTWSSTKATSYSNQSIAKALTYFYYTKKGNASTKEQGMIQAYIWACGKGVNKLTAMNQAAAHFSGGTSPSALYNAINGTNPRGYVASCRVTSCASGKSRGAHQVLLGWVGIDQWKEAEVQKESDLDYTPYARLDIEKKTNSGKLITHSPATFDVYLNGSTKVATLSTTGGRVSANIDLDQWLHKHAVVKSKKYRFAKDWETMSKEAREDAKRKGISYKSKEAAQKAAKAEIKQKKEEILAKWKKLKFNITVVETSPPKGFKISGSGSGQTMKLTTKVKQVFSFPDEEYFGDITIEKRDMDGNPIEGSAVFRLKAAADIHKYSNGVDEIAYRKGAIVKDNITINGKVNNGKVTIKNLYLGSYEIEEIQAPRGFSLNTNNGTLTLNESHLHLTYTCENEEIPHSPNYITIYKNKEMVGVRNSKTVEEGAGFTVIRASALTSTQITQLNAADAAGRQQIISSISAEDIFGTVSTDSEGVGEADLSDPKKDPTDTSPLEDFVLVQTGGEEYYSLSPVIYSSDLKQEQTTIEEPDGTSVDATHYYMEEKDAIVNQAEFPFIKLKKNKQTSKGKEPEKGATFQILDTKTRKPITLKKADGTKVPDDTLTTGTNGETEEFCLTPGEYVVHQVSGEKGYVLMDDETINITEQMMEQYKADKQPITFEYLNLPGPPKLYLKKKSAETDAPVNDAAYKVTDVKGDTVGTFTTGEDEDKPGECSLELPSFGTYVVQEVRTPEGFALDKNPYVCEITDETCEYDEEGNAYYTLEVTDPPIYGEIALAKSGNIVSDYSEEERGFIYELDDFLPGAVYALYAGEDIKKDNGDLVWAEDEEICQLTTDGDKAIKFVNPKANTARKMETTDFWLGKYYVKEVSAPDGYTLDTERHDLVLTDKGLVDTEVEQTELEEVTGPLGNDGVKITTGKYVLETGEALNARLRDKGVTEVHFVYDKAPGATVDVSQDKDGSVVMWNVGTKYYISTQTKGQAIEEMVYFNADSSHMFENLYDVEKIDFDSAYTIYMKNASYMFSECSLLEVLDLSPFNTERVEYVQYMFYNCHSLQKILVFDRSMIVDDEYKPKPVYVTAQPNRIFGLPGTEEVENADETVTTRPEADDPISLEDFTFVVHYEDNTEEELEVVDGKVLTETDKKNNPVTPPADPANPPPMTDYTSAYLANAGSTNAGSTAAIMTVGKHKIYFRNLRVKDPDTGLTVDYRKYTHTESVLTWNDGVETSINVIDPNTVSDDSQVPKAHVDMNMTNNKTTLEVLVTKKDADTGEVLGGAVIGLFANKDIKDRDGNVICKAGDLIHKVETSDCTYDKGVTSIAFDNLPIIPGENNLYYVQEIVPPVGYELNSQKFVIDSSPDMENNEPVEITQRSVTITNKNSDYVTLYKQWPFDDLIPESEGGTGKAINVKVTVNVLKDGVKVGEVVLSKENNWRETFDGNGQIPGLVIQSQDITPVRHYDFEEVIPDDGPYKQVGRLDWDGTTKVMTLYNKFDRTSATIKKVFVDQNNRDGIRPTSVRVKLIGSTGRTYWQGNLSAANSWRVTIDNLPATDADGNKITYHWEEVSTTPAVDLTDQVNGYVPVYIVDEDDPTFTTLENWHGVTSRSIQKIWDDNNDADQRRPDFVDVNLFADGQPAKDFSGNTIPTVRLNESNNWKATVDNLPIVDSSKKDIVYTWKEVTVAYTDKNTSGDGYSDKTILHFNDDHFPIMGTESKGYGYYYSMETDDKDTRLTLLTNTKTIDEKGKITIAKKVRLDVVLNSEIYPTFDFTLHGTTVYGETVGPVTKTVSFTKEKVEEIRDNLPAGSSLDQYVTLEVTFDDLVFGEYYVQESGMEYMYYLSEITDTVSAEINQDNKEVKFFVDADNPDCSATFINEPYLGSFDLIKYASDGQTLLNDVEYKVESPYGETFKAVTGKGIVGYYDENGTFVPDSSLEDTSTPKGTAKVENLLPGTYTVTEVKTLKGLSLLTEPLEVTIPLTMTESFVQNKNVDTAKARFDDVSKMYYFHDLEYTITNTPTLDLPHTGGFTQYLPLIFGLILVLLGGLLKKKEPKIMVP